MEHASIYFPALQRSLSGSALGYRFQFSIFYLFRVTVFSLRITAPPVDQNNRRILQTRLVQLPLYFFFSQKGVPLSRSSSLFFFFFFIRSALDILRTKEHFHIFFRFDIFRKIFPNDQISFFFFFTNDERKYLKRFFFSFSSSRKRGRKIWKNNYLYQRKENIYTNIFRACRIINNR